MTRIIPPQGKRGGSTSNTVAMRFALGPRREQRGRREPSGHPGPPPSSVRPPAASLEDNRL